MNEPVTDSLPLLGGVDIAIIGGGPAGAACALALRTYMPEYRVALVESSAYDATRLGENVSSAILSLLDYLQVKEPFLAQAAHRESFSVQSYWGHNIAMAQHSLRHWSGEGYLLDRSRFDSMLTQHFHARGGKAYLSCRVEAMIPDATSGGYLLHLRHQSGKYFALPARFIVDATGRKANIARRLGAESTCYDDLIGVSRFFTMDASKPYGKDIIIESMENGWWYSAPLPDNQLVVTWMTDASLWREQKAKEHTWRQLLQQAPNTYARMQQAAIAADEMLTLRPAHSHILNRITGKNWLAVGDAAASFDPLSSLGIGYAIHSACHAARAITAVFTENSNEPLQHYAASVRQQFEAYLPTWQQYYRYENRYPHTPFWQNHHKQKDYA